MATKGKAEPVDRFRIVCEASASDMGPIIAQLTRMGLTNIGFELMTDIPAYAQRNRHDSTAEDFAAAWIEQNPTFKLSHLAAHFRESGRGTSAAYYGVKKLVEAGRLRSLGDGNYAASHIKAIAPPHAVTNEETILKFARSHGGKISTDKLRAIFEEERRPRNSLYAAINGLMRDGKIARVGEKGAGEYRLLAKGKAKPKAKKPKPKAPRANGSTSSEVTTNG